MQRAVWHWENHNFFKEPQRSASRVVKEYYPLSEMAFFFFCRSRAFFHSLLRKDPPSFLLTVANDRLVCLDDDAIPSFSLSSFLYRMASGKERKAEKGTLGRPLEATSRYLLEAKSLILEQSFSILKEWISQCPKTLPTIEIEGLALLLTWM